MLLNQIVNEPQKALIYLERFVNNGSPSGFTKINQTSYETSPLSDREFFYLDLLCIDDLVETIGILPDFFEEFGHEVIFIHPDMSKMYKKKNYNTKKSSIRVCPMSSFRTVKFLDFPGYAKLNYNGIIGRIDRSLTDKHVYSSLEMTDFLKGALRKGIYHNLSFFPESGAKLYKSEKDDINIGMVYREEKAFGDKVNEIKYILPMFSLFAHDRNRPDDFLLIQLIRESGKNPEEYFLDDLIFNIIDNYFKLLLNEGIQPEWHAQNLLLGIDSHHSIVSLIMRDLESIDIDQTLQESIGNCTNFKSYPYKYLNSSQYNYQIKHSFMYDFKIGEYVFDPIIKCATECFKLNKNIIEKKIKEYSKQYIEKLPKDFFPENNNWYSFDRVVIDRSISRRPYIQNEKAKYRG